MGGSISSFGIPEGAGETAIVVLGESRVFGNVIAALLADRVDEVVETLYGFVFIDSVGIAEVVEMLTASLIARVGVSVGFETGEALLAVESAGVEIED